MKKETIFQIYFFYLHIASNYRNIFILNQTPPACFLISCAVAIKSFVLAGASERDPAKGCKATQNHDVKPASDTIFALPFYPTNCHAFLLHLGICDI